LGTSRSWGELAGKMQRAAVGVADVPREATGRASLVAKRALEAAAPKRLRGVGKKGAKLGVRYNVGNYPSGAQSLIYATGPWQLIEADTRPHRIPRQRGRRRRYVVIPGVGVRASAQHPGTKGKHPWEKTTTALRPVLPRIYEAEVVSAFRKVF
jgi:hypothetical protein